jgi:peptide/nickel transport system substrate-binding protein
MVITSFPLPKKEAGRLNTLVNFQLIFAPLGDQFSADDNTFTSNGGSGSRNAQLIIPMLAKIGIKVNLDLMDRAILTKRRNAGEFDLYDEAWQADLDPDETIRPEWLTGMPWNYVGYSNPEFDKLVIKASESVNQAERKKLYYAAEDLMMQKDAPIAVLAHTKVYKIFNKRVEGFKYVPVDLMNMHTVSLKKL